MGKGTRQSTTQGKQALRLTSTSKKTQSSSSVVVLRSLRKQAKAVTQAREQASTSTAQHTSASLSKQINLSAYLAKAKTAVTPSTSDSTEIKAKKARALNQINKAKGLSEEEEEENASTAPPSQPPKPLDIAMWQISNYLKRLGIDEATLETLEEEIKVPKSEHNVEDGQKIFRADPAKKNDPDKYDITADTVLGKSVSATILSRKAPGGTAASSTSDVYTKLKPLNKINYARGHLVAKVLGGRGNDERNLTPIHQTKCNLKMASEVEIPIRKKTMAGKVFQYDVTAQYKEGGNNWDKENPKSVVNALASSITVKWQELKPEDPTKWNEAANWKVDPHGDKSPGDGRKFDNCKPDKPSSTEETPSPQVNPTVLSTAAAAELRPYLGVYADNFHEQGHPVVIDDEGSETTDTREIKIANKKQLRERLHAAISNYQHPPSRKAAINGNLEMDSDVDIDNKVNEIMALIKGAGKAIKLFEKPTSTKPKANRNTATKTKTAAKKTTKSARKLRPRGG